MEKAQDQQFLSASAKSARYVPDLRRHMKICEDNYRLIARVLSDHMGAADTPNTWLFALSVPLLIPDALNGDGLPATHQVASMWSLELLESTPYTSLVKLHQEPAMPPWVACYDWRVRLYHDATMAEVVSFQRQRPLNPSEQGASPHLHYRDEKCQTNLFLNQWLTHCLESF